MIKNFIKSNILLASVILYLFIFLIIIILKPKIIFDNEGIPLNFGIGYTKKTILPLWLVIIIISILSYFSVLYYINLDKFIL